MSPYCRTIESVHVIFFFKAEALHEQFDTAFTDEDLSSIPPHGISPFDSTPNIHVSVQGVKKQLEQTQKLPNVVSKVT